MGEITVAGNSQRGLPPWIVEELVMEVSFLSPPSSLNEAGNGCHLPALTSARGMGNISFIP